MRKSKRQPVDSAALTSAWEKVFSQMTVDDLDAHIADGWMTPELVAQRTHVSLEATRCRLKRMADSGDLEQKKIRVLVEEKLRQIRIFRPRS